jgi:hypothetical protein
VTFRVVSLGSCARAVFAPADRIIPVASTTMRPARRFARVELVVCVSLTPERTVYFTL